MAFRSSKSTVILSARKSSSQWVAFTAPDNNRGAFIDDFRLRVIQRVVKCPRIVILRHPEEGAIARQKDLFDANYFPNTPSEILPAVSLWSE